jgi:uncharacterized protein (DUF433 family)
MGRHWWFVLVLAPSTLDSPPFSSEHLANSPADLIREVESTSGEPHGGGLAWVQKHSGEHESRARTMSQTLTAHIHLDGEGVAWIDDTNVKVIEVVLDKLAHAWSAEEIHHQHPDLSLSQIHAAFSYYYNP